jgi:hypothetical protein
MLEVTSMGMELVHLQLSSVGVKSVMLVMACAFHMHSAI